MDNIALGFKSRIDVIGPIVKGLFIAGMLWTRVFAAEVYLWKDEQGNSHFSDRALVGATRIKVRQTYAYSQVKKVFDGDTLLLDDGEKIRLLGINTPEIDSSLRVGEPLSEQAKEYLQRLVEGKKVRIESDVTLFDKYQRKLAHLFTEEGEHINLKLVEKGFAAVNIHPPNIKYLDDLTKAQQHAETGRIGIWSNHHYDPAPIEGVVKSKQRGWRRLLGKPLTIREGRKYTRLLFNERVDVRIPKTNLSYFPDLQYYLSKNLEVRGWVSKRKDKFSILVRHPSALIIIGSQLRNLN